jgi:hypothetical protein
MYIYIEILTFRMLEELAASFFRAQESPLLDVLDYEDGCSQLLLHVCN